MRWGWSTSECRLLARATRMLRTMARRCFQVEPETTSDQDGTRGGESVTHGARLVCDGSILNSTAYNKRPFHVRHPHPKGHLMSADSTPQERELNTHRVSDVRGWIAWMEALTTPAEAAPRRRHDPPPPERTLESYRRAQEEEVVLPGYNCHWEGRTLQSRVRPKRTTPTARKCYRGKSFQRAGDRTRTGDVQLGKLAFYH